MFNFEKLDVWQALAEPEATKPPVRGNERLPRIATVWEVW